jgi:hypothetical protein
VGEVYVAAVVLHGPGMSVKLPTVTVTADAVTVHWPDGAVSTVDLPVG